MTTTDLVTPVVRVFHISIFFSRKTTESARRRDFRTVDEIDDEIRLGRSTRENISRIHLSPRPALSRHNETRGLARLATDRSHTLLRALERVERDPQVRARVLRPWPCLHSRIAQKRTRREAYVAKEAIKRRFNNCGDRSRTRPRGTRLARFDPRVRYL